MVAILLVESFCFLGLMITTSGAVYANGEGKKYTRVSNESYFSTTTYYLDEDEFFSAENEFQDVGINIEKSNKEKFIVGVKQGVFVEEISNGNTVSDSRLLTYDEVYDGSVELNSTHPIIAADIMTRSYLEIIMYMMHGGSSGEYVVYGQARWSTRVIIGGEEYPDAGADDFMIINWGGGDEIKAIERTFSGTYYDGSAVEYSMNIQNAYQGYSWQFKEKKGAFGPNMSYAIASVDIGKTYDEEQGKETNIQFTYVHTYGSMTPTISFSAGYPSGAAAGISVAPVEKSWQIMVEIPGIEY